MLTSGFASRNSNRVTSSGTVSLSSKPAEKISAGDDILHAQAWQGIVQIENVIVKPYGDTTLKALEDEGFCMQEDDYDQLASTEELYLEKEGVEVILALRCGNRSGMVYKLGKHHTTTKLEVATANRCNLERR